MICVMSEVFIFTGKRGRQGGRVWSGDGGCAYKSRLQEGGSQKVRVEGQEEGGCGCEYLRGGALVKEVTPEPGPGGRD